MHSIPAVKQDLDKPHVEAVADALDELSRAQRRLLLMYATSATDPKSRREWHLAVARELVAHSRFIDLVRLAPGAA